MASNLKISNSAANAEANALAALLAGGYVRIYDGTQPRDANSRITTQNKLAELRFSSPAFAAAVDGVIKANVIIADRKAAATGTATWFRCFESDGVIPVLDGSIGLSGCDVNLNSVEIQVGAEVGLDSFVHRVPQ